MLFILDGESVLLRARLTAGRKRAAVLTPAALTEGFARAFLRAIRELEPTYLAAVFSSDNETVARNDAVVLQAAANVRTLVEAAGVCLFHRPGETAADVIASLARSATARGFRVSVLSSRKTLFQIVDDRTAIVDPAKLFSVGPGQVPLRFGVAADRIPDLIALAGEGAPDSPGLPGIGTKTAARLIRECGGLEPVLENPDSVQRQRLRQNLVDHQDLLRLHLGLARLNHSLPILEELETFRRNPVEPVALDATLEDLGLGRMRLRRQPVAASSPTVPGPVVIMDRSEEALAAAFSRTPPEDLVIYCETRGRDAGRSDLVALAVRSLSPERTFFFRFSDPADRQRTLEILRPFLEDPAIPKSGHNLKKDLLALGRAGIRLRGLEFDTMLAGYLLDPERPGYTLDQLCRRHLSRAKRSYREVLGSSCSVESAPVSRAADFLAECTHTIGHLRGALRDRMEDQGLTPSYGAVEHPLIALLADMERQGIRIRRQALGTVQSMIHDSLSSLTRRIYFLAGEPFEIEKPRAVASVLFDRLRLPPVRKTGRAEATGDRALAELAAQHELPGEILEYRRHLRLRDRVLGRMEDRSDGPEPRLYPRFTQTPSGGNARAALTGPWDEPDVPRRLCQEAWGVMEPDPGRVFTLVRFPDLGLRILAALGNDPGLRALVDTETDATKTLTRRLGLPERAPRFGDVLPHLLSDAPGEYRLLSRSFFRQFPALKQGFLPQIRGHARKGLLKTITGRPIPLAGESKAGEDKTSADQTPAAALLRHSGLDLVKKALVIADTTLSGRADGGRVAFPVNSGFVLELPAADAEKTARVIRQEIREAFPPGLPLSVAAGTGMTLAEAFADVKNKPAG